MTVLKIKRSDAGANHASYDWAPVYFKPILGSGERFVVAVLAAGTDSHALASANSLARLDCLYSKNADLSKIVISSGLERLQELIDKDALLVGIDLEFDLNHFEIGEWKKGAGHSADDVAEKWLSALSSLHDVSLKKFELVSQIPTKRERKVNATREFQNNVFSLFAQRLPNDVDKFSSYIRSGKNRPFSKGDVLVDYSGRNLTASFETVGSEKRRKTVDTMKRRLWDLSVYRESSKFDGRHHYQMIVSSAGAAFDPDERADLLEELTEQADKHELRLRQFETANAVVDHIVELEAA